MKSLSIQLALEGERELRVFFFFLKRKDLIVFVDDVMSSRKVGDARHTSEDRGMYGSRRFCR